MTVTVAGARLRPGITALAVLLLIAAAVLYAAVVGTVATINDSDPAGNGLSYAYGVFLALALWGALALLVLVAAVWGEMPGWGKIAALVLVPASGAATLAAIELARGLGAARWAILIPALTPPLLVAQALCAYVPALRGPARAGNAAAALWTVLLIVSLLPWPEFAARERAAANRRAQIQAEYAAERDQREVAKRAASREKFATLDSNSPLWEWWDFTLPGNELRDAALAAMRALPRRQIEAQTMLEGGFALPMTELPNLALEATPDFCQASRRFLLRHAESLRVSEPDPPPYGVVAPRIEAYVAGMRWLLANGCDIRDELGLYAAAARGYPDSLERQKFLATLDELLAKR